MNPCHFGPSWMSTASPSRVVEAPHVEVRLRRQTAPSRHWRCKSQILGACLRHRQEGSLVSRIRRGIGRLTALMENKLLLLPPLQPPCWEFSMALLSFQPPLGLHTLRLRANTGSISHISVGMKADPEAEMGQRRLRSTVGSTGRLDNEREEGVNSSYQILCHFKVMTRVISISPVPGTKKALNYSCYSSRGSWLWSRSLVHLFSNPLPHLLRDPLFSSRPSFTSPALPFTMDVNASIF